MEKSIKTDKKQSSILLFIISIIGSVMYLLLMSNKFIINEYIYNTLSFITCIVITYLIAIVVITYRKAVKKILKRLFWFYTKTKQEDISNHLVFKSLNKKEDCFIINIDDFLFLEALKNHVHIYYKKDGCIITKTLRNTISNISDQIVGDCIFRCHRSFLVNLENVKTFNGNSNGYKIYIHDYEHTIPVSRRYVSEFKEYIKILS